MSDSTNTTDAQPDAAAEDTSSTDQQIDDSKAEVFDADYVRKLRAENAKWRTEAKAGSEAQKRLAELEDSKKTEEQRNTERIAALEAELKAERLDRDRNRVGAEKGLPPSLIALLQGETVDEMSEHADALLADLKAKFVQKTTATPDQTGAGVTGPTDDPNDPIELAKAAMGSRRR